MVGFSKEIYMSYWLAVAGLFSCAFTFAHITGGGDLVHLPMLESELTDVLKGYASVIWHGITANMLVCSVLLLIAAWRPLQRKTLSLVVISHYTLFAVVFIFYGITRFQSVLVMPQWFGFAGIAILAIVGLWMNHRAVLKNGS